MPTKIILFLFALTMLMFITLATHSYSQVNDNSYDYIFAHRYSGIHNLIFLNSTEYSGTEIVNSDKKKPAVQKKIEADSTGGKYSISIRESMDGERILICLTLLDSDNKLYDKEIEIIVYNMLGKKVLDLFKGIPKPEECARDYEIPKGKLPNGLYLCVAQSEKFRIVGKFVISR
ncbi:MAG: hypothetical protein A2X61_13280 [Ignavibacteria bacterium GWB2_35_12]|nr:MAG: hypothetical protein A2X63_12490 [Ignavibacteria bacterium GWA2_35_8]OGU41433.1 MAG: hypothetical protein A2X61_13280 [Ignavibacteria bacterium GWB2_35_12]OGU95004.1 MAG: hypothetical protein A2220_09560 [Ignavibacteria bacterium RIFOXYA2_FULL_35_10]OGV19391.1 MAG: hypothetical protein A2475_04810 [Ignavibacteria bacterium RIFOXYC2_FULL_35_21]